MESRNQEEAGSPYNLLNRMADRSGTPDNGDYATTCLLLPLSQLVNSHSHPGGVHTSSTPSHDLAITFRLCL
jgi:hypothetical protein